MKEVIDLRTTQEAMRCCDMILKNTLVHALKQDRETASLTVPMAQDLFLNAYELDPGLMINVDCKNLPSLFFVKVGTTLLHNHALPFKAEAFAACLLKVIQVVKNNDKLVLSQSRVIDEALLEISHLDLELVKKMMN